MSGDMSNEERRILLICPHPENTAPGQRLKYEQYLGFFRENGYAITVSPFYSPSLIRILYKPGNLFQKCFWVLAGYIRRCFDLVRLPFYDGVYVFLWATPFGTSLFERAFRLLSKHMIYDIDDLVFMKRTSNANRYVNFLKGSGKVFYLMGAADHVLVGTPYLEETAKKYNDQTMDIPVTINTEIYRPTNRYLNQGPICIGWSGSHSTSAYLHLLDKVLRDLNQRHNFKILVIGDPTFKIDGLSVEAMQWMEPTEVRDLTRIDIGLYPLPDDPWVYGKSGGKALQYMALGIPTVATAIGANFRVIEDGVSGFLVKTDEEWIERLERLIVSPDLRKAIGQAGRERVEKYYSVNVKKPTYLNILKQVYGAPGASVQ